MDYRLIAFDLDDTLAPSKGELPSEMGAALTRLLTCCPVGVISGGNFEQFQTQLLEGLDAPESLLQRLHLMPTCGTRYYKRVDGEWKLIYAHDLPAAQKAAAMTSLESRAKELGLWETDTWGPVIEDRNSQITFSALGQQAPVEAKRAWDPDGSKKIALAQAVAADVPDLEVRGGGSTSVDITQKGVDKAYGMNRLMEATGIAKDEILFVGDRLDPEGNDYPVRAGGWPTAEVGGWQDTVRLVERLVAAEES